MGAAPVFISRGIVIIRFEKEIFKVNKFSRIDSEIIIKNNVNTFVPLEEIDISPITLLPLGQ